MGHFFSVYKTLEKKQTVVDEVGDFTEAIEVIRYAIRVVSGTHPELEGAGETARKYVKYGASPRAAQALVTAAKVRALMEGRYNVSYEDVAALTPSVLRHRIKINYTAINDRLGVDDVIGMILKEAKKGR